MLFRQLDLKLLYSIEKIQPKMMMVGTFNGNPTTIIICYNPSNACDEKELYTFNEISSILRSIPKHNVLIIGRDMNNQIGENENNKFS